MTAAALCLLAFPVAAAAATFNVTPGAADATDANPGDGVCDDGTGNCPLRAAVVEANALAGADVIVVPAGTVALTVAGAGENLGATGDLDVTSELTIRGAGRAATVIDQQASPDDRVIDIQSAVPVLIRDLTIAGGTVTGEDGGGIRASGGFPLTLRRVAVTDNRATAASDDLSGGGIALQLGAGLVLEDSLVSGNVVERTDGAVAATPRGAGIATAAGSFVVRRSLIADNATEAPGSTVASGGGIFALTAPMTIEDSTLASNEAPRAGAIFRSSGPEPVLITGTTFAGNEATNGSGGAMMSFAPSMTIRNSTFSGNLSAFDGGALRGSGGTLSLVAVTLTDNSAGGPGDGISSVATTVNLARTILANSGPPPVDECSGSGFNSDGSNLQVEIGGNFDPDCGFGPATNDILATEASLGLASLADNGGPTETHAIGPGSAAHDAVTGACPGPLAADQRGVPRPGRGSGSECDIGAYEHAAPKLRLVAAKALKPGRRLVARASCQGAPCELVARARVKLRGGGRAVALKPKPAQLAASLDPGATRKLAFALSKRQARKLRVRLASPAARKRSRATFTATATFPGELAGVSVSARFKRP